MAHRVALEALTASIVVVNDKHEVSRVVCYPKSARLVQSFARLEASSGMHRPAANAVSDLHAAWHVSLHHSWTCDRRSAFAYRLLCDCQSQSDAVLCVRLAKEIRDRQSLVIKELTE